MVRIYTVFVEFKAPIPPRKLKTTLQNESKMKWTPRSIPKPFQKRWRWGGLCHYNLSLDLVHVQRPQDFCSSAATAHARMTALSNKDESEAAAGITKMSEKMIKESRLGYLRYLAWSKLSQWYWKSTTTLLCKAHTFPHMPSILLQGHVLPTVSHSLPVFNCIACVLHMLFHTVFTHAQAIQIVSLTHLFYKKKADKIWSPL